MQFAKEKMNDMASKSKEKKEIRHAVAQEKAEKKTAKTREEKEIAHEMSKARQAEAKMEYHLEKAEHRAETLAHRAAGKNHVPAQSVLNSGGGGGGAFYNAQGQPVGGVPVRPPGVGAVDAVRPPGVGAADAVRPPGVGAADAVRPPGVGDGASMYGGQPIGGGVGNGASMYGEDTTRLPGGAGYPQGRGYEATMEGGGKNNYVL